MKQIKTVDAVGHILCHDMTQIIRGETKDAGFRKGLYVWEQKEGYLHENDAAQRLAALCGRGRLTCSPVKEGKIDLSAPSDGLFCMDVSRLDRINALGEIMIAARGNHTPVKAGDKLAGTRVIPLVIDEKKLEQAEEIAGTEPLMTVKPFLPKKCSIVTTLRGCAGSHHCCNPGLFGTRS